MKPDERKKAHRANAISTDCTVDFVFRTSAQMFRMLSSRSVVKFAVAVLNHRSCATTTVRQGYVIEISIFCKVPPIGLVPPTSSISWNGPSFPSLPSFPPTSPPGVLAQSESGRLPRLARPNQPNRFAHAPHPAVAHDRMAEPPRRRAAVQPNGARDPPTPPTPKTPTIC